jgi:hypothetical protein
MIIPSVFTYLTTNKGRLIDLNKLSPENIEENEEDNNQIQKYKTDFVFSNNRPKTC